MVSSVLFETAEIVPDLKLVADACARHGATLLVDAYHHLNVVPFDLAAMGLTEAFVVGGGYKYCQLGEGNCFLRVPPGCELRPVLTGWFSEFAELADTAPTGEVRYGKGAARFAGATYDPTSHYRAAAVFAFHQRMGMTPERLRARQPAPGRDADQALRGARRRSRGRCDRSDVKSDRRGGFLAIRSHRRPALWSCAFAREVCMPTRAATSCVSVQRPTFPISNLLDAGGILASDQVPSLGDPLHTWAP